MNRRTFFLGAAGVAILQSGAVGAMIANRARNIANGREVIVESGFVDPRDLFRGHYVTLNLVVGELNAGNVEIDREFASDETVYAELQKGGELFWTAKKLWHEIPEGVDAPFLRGEITLDPAVTAAEPAEREDAPDAASQRYRIAFPFDRYFAPKLRAQELEKFRQDQKLGVVLSVAEDGSGIIKGITVDGEIIYDEPLF